jgi:acetylornithine deacetylase
MGIAPGEDLDAARAELVSAVAGAAAADPWMAHHPPVVDWWGGRFLAAETPVTDPLVTALRSAGTAVLGAPPAREGMTYGADMGLLAGVGGIPTVLFGAGDIRRAHGPDEHVDVAELVAMARTLAVTAVRYCG